MRGALEASGVEVGVGPRVGDVLALRECLARLLLQASLLPLLVLALDEAHHPLLHLRLVQQVDDEPAQDPAQDGGGVQTDLRTVGLVELLLQLGVVLGRAHRLRRLDTQVPDRRNHPAGAAVVQATAAVGVAEDVEGGVVGAGGLGEGEAAGGLGEGEGVAAGGLG